MINLIVALALVALILWTARRFYRPTEMAQHPERYPLRPESKVSKRDLSTVLTQLQRWRGEGKISREEYDRLTDICLAELQQLEKS